MISKDKLKQAREESAKEAKQKATSEYLDGLCSDTTASDDLTWMSSWMAADQPAVPNRLPRRPRRRPEERGLGTDDAVREMAAMYLKTQRKLWKDLVSSGHLPPPEEDVLDRMVESFKRRFVERDVPWPNPADFGGNPLAASYNRFSADSSNHRSLAQQLHLELERAAQNGHFIPWDLVFADAAVTGTVAKRRGYELAKAAMSDANLGVQALYIDEICRASRERIEALRLGKFIDGMKKRLIGASDGFDSTHPMAKLLLSIFSTLQEWFIDQLRAKVNRGLDDAFDRGGNTGLHAPGYKLIPLFDSDGRPVFGKDGEQIKTLAIDEHEAPVVLRVFTMFAELGRSPELIAKFLNRIKFTESQAWDDSIETLCEMFSNAMDIVRLQWSCAE